MRGSEGMQMEYYLNELMFIYSAIKSDVGLISRPSNFGNLNFFDKGQAGNPPADRPGIYIFKIAQPIQFNSQVFNSVRYGSKTNKYLPSGWINVGKCVYVGKSETSVANRLDEHIAGCSKSTYSLRLFDNRRNNLKNSVSIETYYLKDVYANYAKPLLSLVERGVFDTLHPFIGSKRSG